MNTTNEKNIIIADFGERDGVYDFFFKGEVFAVLEV